MHHTDRSSWKPRAVTLALSWIYTGADLVLEETVILLLISPLSWKRFAVENMGQE